MWKSKNANMNQILLASSVGVRFIFIPVLVATRLKDLGELGCLKFKTRRDIIVSNESSDPVLNLNKNKYPNTGFDWFGD